jgi:hypothetical protein
MNMQEPKSNAAGGASALSAGLAGAVASDSECCNYPDPFPLGRVVMPLVRVMERGHLSWAELEEIAWAIQECLRQHKSLMDEHEYHRQASACCQAKTTANKRI